MHHAEGGFGLLVKLAPLLYFSLVAAYKVRREVVNE